MSFHNIDEKALWSGVSADLGRPLWGRDPSFWKDALAPAGPDLDRWGWMDLPQKAPALLDDIRAFAEGVRREEFRFGVLLGMGGSSLCPQVLHRTFGVRKGALRFFALDTSDPAAVRDVEKKIDPARTLFLVSSKSGTTIEVTSLFAYFHAHMDRRTKGRAGRHFAAITDPGTPLEKLAHENGFRKVFLSPPDVGGRFSALTPFGLVPAALLGIDGGRLVRSARAMAAACGKDVPAMENPAIRLGVALGELWKQGKDKLTFILPANLSALGLWLEQLVAESTGKEGKGIVPVEGESLGDVNDYETDRLFVVYDLGRRPAAVEKKIKALQTAGFPVIRIPLKDVDGLGGEFFRWEMATVLAARQMGINPFGEPNVTESKENTRHMLARVASEGGLPSEPPLIEEKGMRLWADADTAAQLRNRGAASVGHALSVHLARARKGDYFSLMAYVAPQAASHRALQALRHKARALGRLATTLGYGPRLLHSTGQLHKGGAATGVHVLITARDKADVPIPGRPYGFSALKMAQALGDFQALKDHRCRVMRIHMEAPLTTLCFER
jgi:glucose-6-phosphate isomerase